jgi:hypothetical protein
MDRAARPAPERELSGIVDISQLTGSEKVIFKEIAKAAIRVVDRTVDSQWHRRNW